MPLTYIHTIHTLYVNFIHLSFKINVFYHVRIIRAALIKKRLDARLVLRCRNLRIFLNASSVTNQAEDVNASTPPPCGRKVELHLLPVLRRLMSPVASDNRQPARTVHATACRRPLASCLVNDVHKFRIYSGTHEWPAAQLGAVIASGE